MRVEREKVSRHWTRDTKEKKFFQHGRLGQNKIESLAQVSFCRSPSLALSMGQWRMARDGGMGWGRGKYSSAGGGRRGACITDDDRKQIGLLPSPVGKGGRTERGGEGAGAGERGGEEMEGENFPYPPFSLVRCAYGRPKYGRRKRLVKFFLGRGRLALHRDALESFDTALYMSSAINFHPKFHRGQICNAGHIFIPPLAAPSTHPAHYIIDI